MDFWVRNGLPLMFDRGFEQSRVFIVVFLISCCAKCFQLVEGLECSQATSAPRLFHYESLLF